MEKAREDWRSDPERLELARLSVVEAVNSLRARKALLEQVRTQIFPAHPSRATSPGLAQLVSRADRSCWDALRLVSEALNAAERTLDSPCGISNMAAFGEEL